MFSWLFLSGTNWLYSGTIELFCATLPWLGTIGPHLTVNWAHKYLKITRLNIRTCVCPRSVSNQQTDGKSQRTTQLQLNINRQHHISSISSRVFSAKLPSLLVWPILSPAPARLVQQRLGRITIPLLDSITPPRRDFRSKKTLNVVSFKGGKAVKKSKLSVPVRYTAQQAFHPAAASSSSDYSPEHSARRSRSARWSSWLPGWGQEQT